MDGIVWVGIGIGLLIAWAFLAHRKTVRRRKYLIEKYGSEEIADKIMARQVWQGMTSEQLIDSWGKPEDLDETVYKTKTKEVWKYGSCGKNRYRQRVYVENRHVVGWQTQ